MPLAVSPAVRFFQRGVRRKRSNSRTRPLFELADPLASFHSAEPSQPASAGQPLLWAFGPFSTLKVQGCSPARVLQPAPFRPQGLATLSTGFTRCARVGFISPRQRSWDSPFGACSRQRYPPCFHGDGPTYRCSRRFFRPQRSPKLASRGSGPARRAAVSGLCSAGKSSAAG
jgi:hypothetical protein